VHLSFRGVKALSVYQVEAAYVVEPNSLGASLPGNFSIQYWKVGAENFIQKGTFARTLRSENGDVGSGSWEKPEF